MTYNAARRVVITGLGVIAPNGCGRETFWQAMSQGISGIRSLARFSGAGLPIQVAGEIADFRAEEHIERKLALRSDRMTHFALAAVQEALQDSGLALEREDPRRIGAVIANTLGGVEYVLEQVRAMYLRGPRFMSAHTATAWLQVANAGQVSLRHGLQGYNKAPLNDSAAGLDALGLACTAIRRGAADVLITGGSEALLHPGVLLVLAHSDHCATGDDPRAYRPFDRRASGLLLAEGAGICILEEYEHARRRHAPIYAEIVGYAQTNSALPLSSAVPDPHDRQYARALRLALEEAGLHTDEIGYLSLDGRALPAWDAAEAAALHTVFGADLAHIPASVPRSMLGHSYAAAGALDAISALLALRTRLIPPTINSDDPDPRHNLPNLVLHEPRPLPSTARAALLAARSLYGANVALVVKEV